MMKLKGWSLLQHGGLGGRIEGSHPILGDNKQVVTSGIVGSEIHADGKDSIIFKTQSGSLYVCHRDDVDPKYEGSYPGAFDRACKALEILGPGEGI